MTNKYKMENYNFGEWHMKLGKLQEIDIKKVWQHAELFC